MSASIRSAMQQSLQDIEVIVVDDGSNDGSIDMISEIKDRRLCILRQANSGKSVAMNRAIRQASGEFYCILDADDEMHPSRIEKQVEALKANSDVAGIFCGHRLLIGNRQIAPRLRAKDRSQCRHEIECMRMPAHDPTGMYRLDMVREVLFEPALRICQGWDYILRVGEQWPFLVMKECLYSYRVHGESVTRSVSSKREDYIQAVLHRACQRREIDFAIWSKEHNVRNQKRRNTSTLHYGLAAHFIESAVDLRECGRFLEAIGVGWECLKVAPRSPKHYKALAYALMPTRLRDCVRSNFSK